MNNEIKNDIQMNENILKDIEFLGENIKEINELWINF